MSEKRVCNFKSKCQYWIIIWRKILKLFDVHPFPNCEIPHFYKILAGERPFDELSYKRSFVRCWTKIRAGAILWTLMLILPPMENAFVDYIPRCIWCKWYLWNCVKIREIGDWVLQTCWKGQVKATSFILYRGSSLCRKSGLGEAGLKCCKIIKHSTVPKGV